MKNIAQKEARKQPKIKLEMSGKGLTVHAGLSPVLTFMGKLLFWNRIQEAVGKKYEANAQYHRCITDVDAMWIDVVLSVDGVYGNQQGADVGYTHAIRVRSRIIP